MLLVIGIDGANPDLVERMTSTGQMPTLRALMRHGVYGRVESSANASPVSAWSSFLTGVNPGMHGAWDLRTLAPESYEWHAPHSRMLRAPTLSQILTERGLEVGTVFVPMTYPAREAEWTTVSGWLAPSLEAEGFAHPRKVASMAARRLKDVPLAVQLGPWAASGRYDAGVERAVEAMNAKCALAEELLADRRWDMLAVNLTELDRVLRWFWHLADPVHPEHREELPAAQDGVIPAMHAAVDAAVSRLIRGLRPEDTVLVISTYGVGLNSRAALCVPELMAHLELLVGRSAAGGLWHGLTSWMGDTIDGVFDFLHAMLPRRLADLVPLPAENETASRLTDGDPWLDYERTWVIPAPGGCLYVNAEDEFPFGVANAAQLDQLTLRISSALQTCIDPATGRRPLRWVRPRDQVCSGPYLARIPHLIARWDNSRVVEGLTVTGSRDGRVKIARPPSGRVPSGAPGEEGVLIAAGGGLRRGVRIEGARVEDLAATVVHLCGERVPSYFEGRVLDEALRRSYLEEHPVRLLQREIPRIIEDPGRATETARVVRDHLRALDWEY